MRQMRQRTRQRLDKAPRPRERGKQEEQANENKGMVINTNSSNLIDTKWIQANTFYHAESDTRIRWNNAATTNLATRPDLHQTTPRAGQTMRQVRPCTNPDARAAGTATCCTTYLASMT